MLALCNVVDHLKHLWASFWLTTLAACCTSGVLGAHLFCELRTTPVCLHGLDVNAALGPSWRLVALLAAFASVLLIQATSGIGLHPSRHAGTALHTAMSVATAR